MSLSSASSSSGNSITLTAGSAGNATITASATISGKTYSKTCSVTVAATKQVASISVSNPKTSYIVDDTFVKPTVIATYNDETEATVTNDTTFTGYDMSVAGNYTVTASYSYDGATATTTYEITVSEPGGSTNIDDYTMSTTPLTSSGITNGMKVVWGTSISNLASSISNNWVYLSSNSSEWLIFTVEGTSGGFKLKCGDNYVYCSGAKKVDFSSSSYTTFTLRADNLVTNGTAGTFYYNSSGLRPYTSGSYTDAYLYALTPKKTLTEIDIDTYPTKMDYDIGDCFDPTGLVITRTYSDSSSDTYAYAGHTSEFTFNPSTSTPLTIDDDTIEVIYGGQSCFFDIEIDYPLVLDSITISGYTTSFTEGDTFSFGGMVIANYEGGSIEDVTSKATYSGYNMTEVGNQTITVSYGGKSTTYQITVGEGSLSSIAVSGQTTTYIKNASFSFDGTCTATFANGYQKVVTPTSVSSPDMSTAGVKTITVSYTYNGNTRTTTYDITINSDRVVIETTTTTGYSVFSTVTWPSNTQNVSPSESVNINTSGYTAIESNAIRLGSGSNTGSITVTASSAKITKIVVSAKTYGSDTGVTLTIGGTNNTITSSYADYVKEFDTATDSVTIATTTSKKRAYIQTITVYETKITTTETDISASEDCIGLETFISTYLHMDYTENLGYCKDNEHHYYSTAKTAFNALNTHQRSLFTSNSAYSTEWARLSTWASKNGEILNGSNQLETAKYYDLVFLGIDYSNIYIIISISSIVSIISVSGYFLLRKRKEK